MRPGSGSPFALMLSGLLVWGGHFTLVYAFNAFICARGLVDQRVLGTAIVPFGIGVITLIALLLLVLFGIAVIVLGRPRLEGVQGQAVHGFSRILTLSVLAYSALAILAQAVPAYIVPACA